MTKPPPDPALLKFYPIPEVAEILGVSVKTVRRWIDAGDLVVHRFGRQLRVSAPDFVRFVKTRRQP